MAGHNSAEIGFEKEMRECNGVGRKNIDGEGTMTETERDKNLLVVCAVKGYAHRHNMTTSETLKLFREYGVTDTIRQCYGTLHTQDIDETVYFAEDYLEARRK
jgi:hypothetical protein